MPKSIQYGTQETLSTLLQAFKEDIFYDFNCHQVGEIVSFNSSKQVAEIEIKMKGERNGVFKEYPLLIDCPVMVLSGGIGRLTLPVQKGDGCVVLFNDRDIDYWYSSGQSLAPRSERKHSFSDAIAIVGLRNKSNSIADYLLNGTELKYGGSTIKLQDNSVIITNGPSTITLSGGSVKIEASSMTIESSSVSVNSPSINLNGTVTIPTDCIIGGKNINALHSHFGVTSGPGSTGGVN